MTKTRLQFLSALFLIVLPFLGFPVWLDSIFVSCLGLLIATTTFLLARERRLKIKSAVLLDSVHEEKQVVSMNVEEVVEPKKTRRTPTRLKKSMVESIENDRGVFDGGNENAEISEIVGEADKSNHMQTGKPTPSPLFARMRKPRVRSRVGVLIGNDSGE